MNIDSQARSSLLWVTVAAGSINPLVVRSILLLDVSALHTERKVLRSVTHSIKGFEKNVGIFDFALERHCLRKERPELRAKRAYFEHGRSVIPHSQIVSVSPE